MNLLTVGEQTGDQRVVWRLVSRTLRSLGSSGQAHNAVASQASDCDKLLKCVWKLSDRVACATHANMSRDLALVPRRLGGGLLSACGILLTLHLFCSQSSFSEVVHSLQYLI